MNNLRTIFIAVGLLTSSLCFSQDFLPDATVVNDKGESVNLKEYVKTGGPKIVSLWATWCAPCRMELKALKKVSARWKAEYDVEIVTVSVDVPAMVKKARQMFEKNGWDYTFMHDADEELTAKLGVRSIPYSMLIDKDGKILSVQTGYSPTYEQELERKLKSL